MLNMDIYAKNVQKYERNKPTFLAQVSIMTFVSTWKSVHLKMSRKMS